MEMEPLFVWQEQLRFDVSQGELTPRKGEYRIDSVSSIEDTKGNSSERGSIVVTNLRVIWVAERNPRTNLSVGHSCISTIQVRKAKSRIRGNVTALNIVAKYQGSRFEFIFTSLMKTCPRLFTTVQTVLKAYEGSKLYRDLKLRGSIIKDNQLILLPQEELYSKVTGVWNLSSDQGNLGTLFTTNIRMAWCANLAPNFNVSIPYIQMKGLRLRESKFGPALVVETSPRSGGYILGFRIDPSNKLGIVHKELVSLHQVFSNAPIFGVQCSVAPEEQPSLSSQEDLSLGNALEEGNDDVVVEDEGAQEEAAALYFADRNKNAGGEDRGVVFDAALGLAVEQSREKGISIDTLWRII